MNNVLWVIVILNLLEAQNHIQNACSRNALRNCTMAEIQALIDEETKPKRPKGCVATGLKRYTGAAEYDCGGYKMYK